MAAPRRVHRPGGLFVRGGSGLLAQALGNDCRQLCAVADAELGVDVREVGLDGGSRHEKLLADLRVGETCRGMADDLELRWGQAVPAGHRAPPWTATALDPGDDLAVTQRLAAGIGAAEVGFSHGGVEPF